MCIALSVSEMQTDVVRKEAGLMSRFRIICPECAAEVITSLPEAMIWELCPRCRHHVWDVYDTIMADKFTPDAPPPQPGAAHFNN